MQLFSSMFFVLKDYVFIEDVTDTFSGMLLLFEKDKIAETKL